MARITNVISSIISGGKSSEAVTVDSTSWTTDSGTITLSAAVPGTVKVGDIITDSATNSYLITGIAGSVLTAQDFDSATDPATGAGAITEAYQTLNTWKGDHDDTILHRSGDTAKGEAYKNATFDEMTSIDLGLTVGLIKRILTVPVSERHSGLAAQGTRIARSTGATFDIVLRCAGTIDTEIEWLEINGNSQISQALAVGVLKNIAWRRMILHDMIADAGLSRAMLPTNSSGGVGVVMNSIIYDIAHTAGGGLGNVTMVELSGFGKAFNVVADRATSNASFKTVEGYQYIDSSGFPQVEIKNCIGMNALDNDFTIADPTDTIVGTNISSDATAPGAGNLRNQVTSDIFISTVNGSENYLQKDTSIAKDIGTDLGTTPPEVNVDILNRDRDALGDDWDVGAHEIPGRQLIPFTKINQEVGNILVFTNVAGIMKWENTGQEIVVIKNDAAISLTADIINVKDSFGRTKSHQLSIEPGKIEVFWEARNPIFNQKTPSGERDFVHIDFSTTPEDTFTNMTVAVARLCDF